MCKARFHVVTRLRDEHIKRFRGNRQRRPTGAQEESPVEEEEEEEIEGIRAVCMHCGNGDREEQLMLCDGEGCDHVGVLLSIVNCVCFVLLL